MKVRLVALLLAIGMVACNKQSPDELIALLSKTGAKIEKDGSRSNEPPAEMNMRLIVDGTEGFTVVRFPSTGLARDYCQTEDECFTVNYWAVGTWRKNAQGAAWAKLLAAAGQPVPTSSTPPRAAPPTAPPRELLKGPCNPDFDDCSDAAGSR
jgi:hypothetical protein